MKLAFWSFSILLLIVAGIGAYADLVGFPPQTTHIVVATGGSEGLYDALAQTYKKELEKFGVVLDLKPDIQGNYSLKAMVFDNSAQAAFIKGGFVGSLQGRLANATDSDRHTKDVALLGSVGRLFREPVWVFTRKDDKISALRDLKGKRIYVGPSGVLTISTHLLKASGVENREKDAAGIEHGNAAFVWNDSYDKQIGTIDPAVEPSLADKKINTAIRASLIKKDIDAAIFVLPPESETIHDLLLNPELQLMDFSAEADAYVNRFSYLSKVVLHQGAVELNPDIPARDLVILATEAAFVVRKDLNPSLVTLLTHAVFNNPKLGYDSKGDSILFYRAGEFPSDKDSEFDVMPEAKAIQANHELPFLIRELGPLNARLGLPFGVTAFANEHGNQLILLLIPLLTVLIPLVRVAPAAYNWAGRRRLLYWYRRLKNLERGLAKEPSPDELTRARGELETIDAAVNRIRVPLAFTSQLYDLRLHINLVRDRLSLPPARIHPAE